MKTKTVYILLYLGDYYDEFDTYEDARSIKEDYNSWFSQNSKIVKRIIKL